MYRRTKESTLFWYSEGFKIKVFTKPQLAMFAMNHPKANSDYKELFSDETGVYYMFNFDDSNFCIN